MSFASGLSPDRSLGERVEILDRYYQAYQDKVRNAPEGHAMDYVHIYLVLRKE